MTYLSSKSLQVFFKDFWNILKQLNTSQKINCVLSKIEVVQTFVPLVIPYYLIKILKKFK